MNLGSYQRTCCKCGQPGLVKRGRVKGKTRKFTCEKCLSPGDVRVSLPHAPLLPPEKSGGFF